MKDVRIRFAEPKDRDPLARLLTALWPESPLEEHAGELDSILAGKSLGLMPLIILVAEAADGTLLGFLEAGLRSCSDGCDVAHPVGYVEGWYVIENARRQGIGSKLLKASENWAREQGCIEMASDTSIENHVSQHTHEALGFEPVERSIIYRKKL